MSQDHDQDRAAAGQEEPARDRQDQQDGPDRPDRPEESLADAFWSVARQLREIDQMADPFPPGYAEDLP